MQQLERCHGVIQKHDQSSCHREAVEVLVTLSASTRDISETLSQQHAKEKEGHRKILPKIISNIKFLARQGLALRSDGSESESNFLQLIKLRGEEDSSISDWLARKVKTYTSHEVQDELLSIFYNPEVPRDHMSSWSITKV